MLQQPKAVRFFQARIALFTIVLAAGGRGPRNPSDFCAVQLLATDSARGQPVVSGVAELIASSGRVTQTKKVINGRVEFCDFGFGEYSILIHYERSQCAATEIKNIHVVYGFTQQLSAVLNSCVDEADVGPGTMCPTYVRGLVPKIETNG